MDIEKAIKRCEDIIKKNNKVVKEARKIGDTNTMQLIAGLDGESLAIETVLNMLKEKDKEIEHQIEKRNNQKAELAILNEKQKEMNKLINTVKSYEGQIKRIRKIEKLEQENNKQKAELEMYKDFKEIANTKIGDANPLKVLEVNKILDRQCKRQQFTLDKIVDLIKNETINISGFKCIAIKDLQDIIKGGKQCKQ